jgi:glyoxylase-like metal-dependent hydrolase (beta-lactamase superfamily II)
MARSAIEGSFASGLKTDENPMSKSLRIFTIETEPFFENAYVVAAAEGSEAAVVDPSFDVEPIVDCLRENKLEVVAIWNTHGHLDHIAGNHLMKGRYPQAPLLVGANDAPLLPDPLLNGSILYGYHVASPPADSTWAHGDKFPWLGVEWEVREIPGHSPGSVVLICLETNPPVVLGGDVLFQGGIGRFDLPGGDGKLLVRGIREKLYDLPDETVVLPGHGPSTTIGVEKATNPFTAPGSPLLD